MENEQFEHLINAVKQYTFDITIRKSKGYAFGTIAGYKFRIFQEDNNPEYSAYLLINDEHSTGIFWSAFYDKVDIDEWYFKKALEGKDITYCSGKGCPVKHLCGRNIEFYQQDNNVYLYETIPADFDLEGKFKHCDIFFNSKASIDDAINLQNQL